MPDGGAEGPRYGLPVARAFGPRAEVRVPGGGSWVKAGADAQITDLTVDDHAFRTFGEPEELFDLTAAFVRAGRVCGGLKAVWVREARPQRS
jgi:hypothetical protein